MNRTASLILLCIGLAIVTVGTLSSPFYGFLSSLLYLLGGLLLLISILATLFLKEKIASRFSLTAVLVVILFGFFYYAHPLTVDLSYKRFIKRNQAELSVINNILQTKQGKIEITEAYILDELGEFTLEEKNDLQSRRKKLGVYLISRTDYGIFYGISGGIGDIRLGATYQTSENYLSAGDRKLLDKWYR
jgi:hypothetical protein